MRTFARLAILGVLVLVVVLGGCVPDAIPPTATPAAPSGAPGATNEAVEPVTWVTAGDDWGYPTPFAMYPRGPGYVRMSYLFDTLVWKDEEGYVPWLAEEWAVADDGVTWTFRLRQGVTWHDGRPLTADDVAFSYLYLKEAQEKGMVTWGWLLQRVASAEVIDGGAGVAIRMTEPTAGLLTDLFGSVPIIPEHIWSSVKDPAKKLDAEAVIGSSLFMLNEYNKEEGRYVYDANADFFLGKPAVDRLIFIKVKDAALALLSGDIDEASFSGKGISSVHQFEGKDEYRIAEGPNHWALKLYLNPQRPPLDDRRVRQAIAHAIDRQEIVDKAQMGGAIVASLGILSPGTYWHNPNLPIYPHDLDKARQLLAEVGVASPALTLVTTETYAREAEFIQGYLKDAGIAVTVQTGDQATVDGLLREGNYDLLITGHGLTANPDMEEPAPRVVWSDPAYDAAYEASTRAVDDEDRRGYAWTMQEILATELPVLALWHPLMWEVYRPDVVEPFYTSEGVDGGIPLAANKLMFIPCR
jgi:peptide/nickel transport system substrate-binding protein